MSAPFAVFAGGLGLRGSVAVPDRRHLVMMFDCGVRSQIPGLRSRGKPTGERRSEKKKNDREKAQHASKIGCFIAKGSDSARQMPALMKLNACPLREARTRLRASLRLRVR